MHGLRCDPMLLGWTRLLDEWVVGLTRYNRDAPTEPVCWEERGTTLLTLADAATRVRSFAYQEADIEPTVPLEDAASDEELAWGCCSSRRDGSRPVLPWTVLRQPREPRIFRLEKDGTRSIFFG